MEETKYIIEGVLQGSDKVLTFKGLSSKANIPVQEAKKVLELYWAQHAESLEATFVYSMIDEQGNRKWLLSNQHSSSQLPLVTTISKSIYSISRHKVSEPSLICSDDVQRDRIMTLAPAEEKNELRDNRFSSVLCSQVKHSCWNLLDSDSPNNWNVGHVSMEVDIDSVKKEESNNENPKVQKEATDEDIVPTRRRRKRRTIQSTDECSLEDLEEEKSSDPLLLKSQPEVLSNPEKENTCNLGAFCQKLNKVEAPKKKSVRTTTDASGNWVTEVVEEEREPLYGSSLCESQQLEDEPSQSHLSAGLDQKKTKSSVSKQLPKSESTQKSIFSFFQKKTFTNL